MKRKCYDYNIKEYRITEDLLTVFSVKTYHTQHATLAYNLIRICHIIIVMHPGSIILFDEFLMLVVNDQPIASCFEILRWNDSYIYSLLLSSSYYF